MPRYRSYLGSFVSCLITVAMCIYVVFTLNTFRVGLPEVQQVVLVTIYGSVVSIANRLPVDDVDNLPDVSDLFQSVTFTRTSGLDLVSFGSTTQIAFQFTSITGINLANASSLVKLTLKEKLKVNKQTTKSTNIPFYPCDMERDNGNIAWSRAENTLCLDLTNIGLQGTYSDRNFTYIKWSITPCVNGSSSGVICNPFSEIEDAVSGANFNVIAREFYRLPNDEVRSRYSAPHWRLPLNYGVSQNTDIFMEKFTLSKSVRLIGNDQIGDSDDETTLQIDYREAFDSKNDRSSNIEFAEIFLRISPTEKVEIRQFQSFLDVLANWGAMFGFLVATIGFATMQWNQYWFGKQLPPDKKHDWHSFRYEDFYKYGVLKPSAPRQIQRRQTIYKLPRAVVLDQEEHREAVLQELQIVFLVDRSGSMAMSDTSAAHGKGVSATRWENALSVVQYLASTVFGYDKDSSIPVIFFDTEIKHSVAKSPEELISMFQQYQPRGTTKMLEAFQFATKKYLNKHDTTLFICITDGEPDSPQAPQIKAHLTKTIAKSDPQGERVNVLFVRVGDDVSAVAFLQDLDDCAAIGENVDTKSDSVVFTMTPKEVLSNAIFEHLDEVYQPPTNNPDEFEQSNGFDQDIVVEVSDLM